MSSQSSCCSRCSCAFSLCALPLPADYASWRAHSLLRRGSECVPALSAATTLAHAAHGTSTHGEASKKPSGLIMKLTLSEGITGPSSRRTR